MSGVGLPCKASVGEVSQPAAKAMSKRWERGLLALFCTIQLAWIAALGYGAVWLTRTVGASF